MLVSDPMMELKMAKRVYIKQEVELLEVFTGCETQNRYHVFADSGNGIWTYLFKCKETSGWCARNCIGRNHRPIDIKIKHVFSHNLMFDDDYDMKTYAHFSRPFECCVCCNRYLIYDLDRQ
jgi:hypothetical protein